MLEKGIVTRRSKGFYFLHTNQNMEIECKVKGQLFKHSRFDNQIAVGDIVSFQKNENEEVGVITAIEPRRSFLSRSRIGANVEQIIAANIDLLLIIASTKEPEFRINFINRLLVAADIGNVKPILVLTKTDLATSAMCDLLMKPYRMMGLETILFSIKNQNPSPRIYELLSNNVCVLSGQSGTGKSSLLNVFFPKLKIRVGAVSQKTSKGSHTTTYAVMHLINNGSVIDTPGIREFGLWRINRQNLAEHYPMIRDYHNSCKHRDCRHISEPGCNVKLETESGRIPVAFYQGYLSTYESLPA